MVNVSNPVKDRTFDLTARFNISANHIVSFLNGDLMYQDGAWTLTPPKRERRLTAILPHTYDPKATAPAFMQFLDDIFFGQTDALEKSNLLLQHIGCALQTHNDFERFAIYVSSGPNIKSVFLHTVKELLGSQNVAAV